MASPDVFKSSPLRELRRESHMTISSSPDLPSLQDMISQKPKPKPPILRSGSKAIPIPDDAPTGFTKAGSLWKVAQAQTATSNELESLEPIIDVDAPATVVEAPSPTKPKPQTEKRRKKKPETEARQYADSPTKEQPWKKFKATSNEDDGKEDIGQRVTADAADTTHANDKPRKQTGTMSSHFQRKPEARPAKTKSKTTKPADKTAETDTTSMEKAPTKAPPPIKADTAEPLQLEPAMARRLDWTPPRQNSTVIIPSDSPAIEDAPKSTVDEEEPQPFQNLLETYRCKDASPPPAAANLEDDSDFLKKRKRIELLPGSGADAGSARLEKSPSKEKAPKKKARTITDLATAAYKAPSEPDPEEPAPPLQNFLIRDEPETKKQKPGNKGKGPAKPRKRSAKVSKKKAQPAKPVLLSPLAALRQVANQDFVFGTSSQLATEHSPSFLRDLQAAMRHSNQLEHDTFETPINSDAIGPPEQVSKLWNAAARDAEGDLFDLEVINLVDGSPELPPIHDDSDPFGYVKGDEDHVADQKACDANEPQTDDSFVNLSDILRPLGTPPVETAGKDTSLSENQTTLHQPQGHLPGSIAISRIGPAKKRSAVMPLLDHSPQRNTGLGLGSTVSVAAMSTAATSAKAGATSSPKRPRGRPRKNSMDEPDIQEPPPSAQPPMTPKRPRGRPRKDATSPSRAAKAKATKKAGTSPKKSARAAASPKRAKTPPRVVYEIPDSASDISASPCSSPEQTFSPPTVDMSLSVDEDTELSLTMSPTEQQVPVFTHITKAIQTAPRTRDPENPSWHEKILLYDPIVLEDLADWLNSGQLAGVGYDGVPVTPAEVKKWCESKSVCCLWKVSLRGKERKRY